MMGEGRGEGRGREGRGENIELNKINLKNKLLNEIKVIKSTTQWKSLTKEQSLLRVSGVEDKGIQGTKSKAEDMAKHTLRSSKWGENRERERRCI